MLKSKTCKACEVTKDLSEFYKSNNGTTYRGRCKSCRVIIDTRRNNSTKIDHYLVYYLPEENYCGITNNPPRRMSRHKFVGNDTNNWRVLATAKTREEALITENKYHKELGMNGGYKKAIKITN